jgi:ABC-type amino acid transport substrate-binding protein
MGWITRWRRLAGTLGLIVMASAFVPGPALAADESALATAKKRGRLIVGTKYDFPPYGFVSEKKEVVGLEPDMAREFALYLFGNRDAVEFVEVTSANRVPFLVTNKVDIMIATMTITPERAKLVAFSEPYYNGGMTILVPKDNVDITKMADLAGKRVIVTQGGTNDVIVSKLNPPPAQILKFAHITECFSALIAGRADAFVQDVTILKPFADKNPAFKLAGGLYNDEPWGVGVRKDDAETLEWVNASLKRLKQSGRWDEFVKRWLSGN